ncbi:unnamed protein product [Adineta steineri]|uniref:FAD-binding PCMH-type domain-containing protein n=1 Tax=Adineta steineri TaxID=433720 RepID=A0A819T9T3_9BILA|nr:unnamed protein product [Adineta steineri]
MINIFILNWFFILFLLCIFQVNLITTTHLPNYRFTRTNNNDLYTCLSSLLPLTVRTIYPCSTIANQNSFQYECVHFNITNLSAIRGGRFSHSPAVIVYVTDSSDVQNVLVCAANLNYVVNALSGGHSYEGYGLGSTYNNIIINMEGINYININQHDRTGTFGAGTRLGPIYYEAYQSDNYTINAGSCPWVGLTGHALGGGYGLLSRLHGLLSDNVLEMKAVNAHGELLTINETHEPDLYWALRGGGGGSFVIVTEFKIRLVKAPTLTTQYSLVWYPNASKLVIQRYQLLMFNNTIFNLSNDLFLSMTVNHLEIRISITYFGIELDVPKRSVALFLETLPTPNITKIHSEDWLTFVYDGLGLGNINIDHQHLLLKNSTMPTYCFKAKHVFYDKPISDHGLDQFLNRIALGIGELYITFSPWDGYIHTIPIDKTAFPHRRYKFGIQLMIYCNDTNSEKKQMKWLNEIYSTIYRDSTKHSYINYMDRDVPNWMDYYYNTHQQRLHNLKYIYDKNNRFYFEKTIK